jgi:hypothetical protein
MAGIFPFALLLTLLAVSEGRAQDTLTIGSATVTRGPGVVAVPIHLRDAAGTPLGVDQPAGSRIQAFSVRISWSPASAVKSVSFGRAGILKGLTPMFETTVPGTGTISWLAVFPEASAPVPFTLNAPLPGDRIATLLVTLDGSAAAGGSVAFAMDPSSEVTTLSNQAGTVSETMGGGSLSLVDGLLSLAPCEPVGSGVAPGAPTLTSPAAGATGVSLTTTLRWTPVDEASRYKVYLGTSNPPPFYSDVAWPASSLSVILDSTPSAGIGWFWKVVAMPVAGSGSGSSSSVGSFTTAPATETVSAVAPTFLDRWDATARPLSLFGTGFAAGLTTIGWRGPSASPGATTGSAVDATTISATLAPSASSFAGFYDVQAAEYGSAVASLHRGLALRAFADVTEADWYFESSDRMVQAGIQPQTSGAAGPLFEPTRIITRGDMAEALVKAWYWALGTAVPDDPCSSWFPDVPCDHPQRRWIEEARDLGITLGNAQGNFVPDANVTRTEMAAFLTRLRFGGDANVPKCEADPGWSDLASIPAWGLPYVDLLRVLRITAGCGASPLSYCPLGSVQKSDLSMFLARLTGALPLP